MSHWTDSCPNIVRSSSCGSSRRCPTRPSRRSPSAPSGPYVLGSTTRSSPCGERWRPSTMSEKDLGKALLKLGVTELSGLPDVREQTWAILERDRRRVRRLTGLTVGAWLLATVLILNVLVAFGFLFPRVAKLRMDSEQGTVTQDQRERLRDEHDLGLMKGTLVIAFSVAALSFAALCTV